MELHKLSAEEVRGWEPAKRKETADDIRRELGKMRMDIYTSKNQNSGKVRGMKKSLARLLTVAHQDALKAAPAPKAKKVAAPVAKAKKPKAAKPAASKTKAKTSTKAKGKGDKK